MSVLDVLRGQAPRVYRVNAEALSYLATLGVPARVGRVVATWPADRDVAEDELTRWLAADLPALGPQQAPWVREAPAVAAYQAQTDRPVIRALLTDDAAP